LRDRRRGTARRRHYRIQKPRIVAHVGQDLAEEPVIVLTVVGEVCPERYRVLAELLAELELILERGDRFGHVDVLARGDEIVRRTEEQRLPEVVEVVGVGELD